MSDDQDIQRKPFESSESYTYRLFNEMMQRMERDEAKNAELSQSFQTVVELLRKHDEQLDKHETKNAELGQSFVTVVELLRRHNERLDEVREVQSDVDVRIAALVDAQIHTDDAITRLTARVDGLTVNVDRLAGRVDRLAETVDRYIEGRNGQG